MLKKDQEAIQDLFQSLFVLEENIKGGEDENHHQNGIGAIVQASIDKFAQKISGVVHASGLQTTIGSNPNELFIRFAIEPWKDSKGKILPKRLVLQCSILKSDLDLWKKEIQPFQIVNLSVLPHDTPYAAELLEVLDLDEFPDKSLRTLARNIQKKLRFVEPFGYLQMDPVYKIYNTEVLFKDELVRLYFFHGIRSIEEGNYDYFESTVKACKKLIENKTKIESQIRYSVAKFSLTVVNEVRQKCDLSKLSVKDIYNEIVLFNIFIYFDSTYKFNFHDGGLLGGYQIQASGKLNRKPTGIFFIRPKKKTS